MIFLLMASVRDYKYMYNLTESFWVQMLIQIHCVYVQVKGKISSNATAIYTKKTTMQSNRNQIFDSTPGATFSSF